MTKGKFFPECNNNYRRSILYHSQNFTFLPPMTSDEHTIIEIVYRFRLWRLFMEAGTINKEVIKK